MQTVVSKIGNTNLTFSVHAFPDEVLVNKYGNLQISSFSYGMNTRHKLKLHKPSTKLTMYQKGVYYSSIKIYNKHSDVIPELVSS